MSQEIKCPYCKRSGIITYGFFAVCASEDCTWAGTVCSVGSTKLMNDALLNGFSPFHERRGADNVHSTVIKRMIEEAAKNKGSEITLENTIEADKMGSINVYVPTGTRMSNTEFLPCKLHILKTMQNAFLYFKDLKFPNEGDKKTSVFDKFRSEKTGEQSAFYEEYGFPPLEIQLDFDNMGIKNSQWKFSRDSKIWQPIDWSCINLSKDSQIKYLAVLQMDGQNFTYLSYEDMNTGVYVAGISRREYGCLNGSFTYSSADNVEDATKKLIKHYDTTHNKLVYQGDPIEVSWSKEFDYDSGVWSVCSSIISSDMFSDDCTNEALSLLDSSRRDMYATVYEQSLEPE